MGSNGARKTKKGQASKPGRSSGLNEKPGREDWSPRRFYDTMRRLFRPRPDPRGKDGKPIIRLVDAPFYQHRALSRSELYAAVEHFLAFQGLERRILKQKAASVPILDHSDLLAFGVPPEKSWPYIGALGRLHFAETANQQSQARREVKTLAQHGPRALRRFLKEVLKGLPQRKLRLTHREVMLKLVRYRKERQFVWTFLRHEAMAGWRCSRQDLRNPRLEWISELVQAYSFLRLTPDQLKHGLSNSHQADEDVAEEFGLSTKTLRSLLSKHHPLVKSKHT